MQAQFIFTADDFGPIDFINEGVYHLVKHGALNSVQVIVNNETQASLQEKLTRLANSVPEGKIVDIGIHYTLTSGSPMHTNGAPSKAIKAAWGDMVERKNGTYVFMKSSKFDNDYRHHLDSVKKELEFQKDFLATAYEAVQKKVGEDKLVFTSASNHHNYFTIAPDIFLIYQDISFHYGDYSLSIRSPKALPRSRARNYYGLVSRLFNFRSSRAFRRTIRTMNRNFELNLNYGGPNISIKSSSYADIGFYRSLGSLRFIDLADLLRRNAWNRKRNKRQKALFDMIQRSKQYQLIPERDPENLKVTEFIFHVGHLTDGKDRKNVKNRDYEKMAKDYHGITYKYFDDRLVEASVLQHFKTSKFAEDTVFDHFVSWDQCGNIQYHGSNK